MGRRKGHFGFDRRRQENADYMYSIEFIKSKETKLKYRIIKPYQLIASDNKIYEYPIGMILETDKSFSPFYTNITETPHNLHLMIKPEVVENNPEYFEAFERYYFGDRTQAKRDLERVAIIVDKMRDEIIERLNSDPR